MVMTHLSHLGVDTQCDRWPMSSFLTAHQHILGY